MSQLDEQFRKRSAPLPCLQEGIAHSFCGEDSLMGSPALICSRQRAQLFDRVVEGYQVFGKELRSEGVEWESEIRRWLCLFAHLSLE